MAGFPGSTARPGATDGVQGSLNRWRASAALAFVLALLPLIFLTHRCVFLAGNDASRFAQIEALVDHGEPYIDHSQYQWTVDRVDIGGHAYSNKPPVMALAGAAVYLLLETLTGWTFRTHEAQVVRALVVILVGLPTAWLVARFYLALGLHRGLSPMVRWLTTAALAWGTILTSFSVTLNNHTVAAALLFVGVIDAVRGRPVWAGAWVGLTVCVDIVPGLIFVPVLLWIVGDLTGRRGVTRSLAALASCALLFLLANLVIVGSLLPPKLVPGGVDQSSYVTSTFGNVQLPERWTYPLECLLGGHGLFSVSPVLLFGAFGLFVAMCRPKVLVQRWCRQIGAAITVTILGHVVLVGSYGGWSYGFRYLIPVIPLLLFFTPVVLTGWRTKVFVPALVVSVGFALLGAYHPWPPAYEREATEDPVAALVTNPVGGNAAAWLEHHFPSSRMAAKVGAMFVSPSPELRRAYYSYFSQSMGGPAL